MSDVSSAFEEKIKSLSDPGMRLYLRKKFNMLICAAYHKQFAGHELETFCRLTPDGTQLIQQYKNFHATQPDNGDFVSFAQSILRQKNAANSF